MLRMGALRNAGALRADEAVSCRMIYTGVSVFRILVRENQMDVRDSNGNILSDGDSDRIKGLRLRPEYLKKV